MSRSYNRFSGATLAVTLSLCALSCSKSSDSVDPSHDNPGKITPTPAPTVSRTFLMSTGDFPEVADLLMKKAGWAPIRTAPRSKPTAAAVEAALDPYFPDSPKAPTWVWMSMLSVDALTLSAFSSTSFAAPQTGMACAYLMPILSPSKSSHTIYKSTFTTPPTAMDGTDVTGELTTTKALSNHKDWDFYFKNNTTKSGSLHSNKDKLMIVNGNDIVLFERDITTNAPFSYAVRGYHFFLDSKKFEALSYYETDTKSQYYSSWTSSLSTPTALAPVLSKFNTEVKNPYGSKWDYKSSLEMNFTSRKEAKVTAKSNHLGTSDSDFTNYRFNVSFADNPNDASDNAKFCTLASPF